MRFHKPILAGTVFGRLTVVEFLGISEHGHALYECSCKCGKKTTTMAAFLRKGHTQSCGCLHRERVNEGQGRRRRFPKENDPILAIWRNIIFRCYNPKSSAYENYGKRGIKVCDRWRESVKAFVEDMGNRPTSKHTIERINNEGDYEPGNCRWATRKEQARNRRRNVWLTHDGKTLLLTDWSTETGIPMKTLWMRLNRGWTAEKALTTPVRQGNYRKKRNC